MKLLSRREFVQGGLLCSAIALAAEPRRPKAEFPGDPRLRAAVASYPFRAMIAAPNNSERDPAVPGMDVAGFGRYVKATFGVSAIEPLDSHFPSKELTEVRALRGALDAAGVRVVNIPVDEDVELCSEDPAKREAGQASYRRWIDIAVILSSPSIRIWIPKCSDSSDLKKAIASLKPTLDYAATQNIVVNLENDDPVTASEPRTVAAIQLADTPFLRALPDFGNGLMGGDEVFNAAQVRGMFPYAWNIAHVKDAELVNGVQKTAKLEQLFAIAKAAKYRGYYSMESDSHIDPVPDTKHLIERSLALM